VIDGRRAINDFVVHVVDVRQLNKVIADLSRLRGVSKVERLRG
jgi:hypothetical protein